MPKKTQVFDAKGNSSWIEGDVIPAGHTLEDPKEEDVTVEGPGQQVEEPTDPEENGQKNDEQEAQARAEHLATFSYEEAMKTPTKDALANYAAMYGYELDTSITRAKMIEALTELHEAEKAYMEGE